MPRPAHLTFQRHDECWIIGSGADSIAARALVFASGALIPDLARRICKETADVLTVQKIEVLTVSTELSRSLFAVPRTLGAPNVCPFEVGDARGVTVCLTGDDQDASGAADVDPRSDARERFSEQLADYIPGIGKLVPTFGAWARIYCCQKVRWSSTDRADDRRPITIDFEQRIGPSGRRCFAVYPGKFTTAKIVGREFAARLSESLEGWSFEKCNDAPIEIEIARQRYLHTDQFRIVPDGDGVTFV